MPTAYTVRLIIVIREGFSSSGNTAAKLVDRLGGERTFTVPLRLKGDTSNTVRARWCCWQMTPQEAEQIHTRLDEQGVVEGEVVLMPEADQTALSLQAKTFVFDANDWEPQQVLDVLNLDTLEVTP